MRKPISHVYTRFPIGKWRNDGATEDFVPFAGRVGTR